MLEEAGEIVAELRKPLFKGNFHEKELDIDGIKSELGDLIWYMSFVCKNNKIDMDKLGVNFKEYDKEYSRENLIKYATNIGKQSGVICKRYIKCEECRTSQKSKEDYKEKQKKLKKSINKQFKNVYKIASSLDIDIESILETNLGKVNSRYKKDGSKVDVQMKDVSER